VALGREHCGGPSGGGLEESTEGPLSIEVRRSSETCQSRCNSAYGTGVPSSRFTRLAPQGGCGGRAEADVPFRSLTIPVGDFQNQNGMRVDEVMRTWLELIPVPRRLSSDGGRGCGQITRPETEEPHPS